MMPLYVCVLTWSQAAYHDYNPTRSWAPADEKEVMIGFIASDVRMAARGLRDWCQGLGLKTDMPKSRVSAMGSWV